MSDSNDGYDTNEAATSDVGRVMDEIGDIDGVAGVHLEDYDPTHANDRGILWTSNTLHVEIRPSDATDSRSGEIPEWYAHLIAAAFNIPPEALGESGPSSTTGKWVLDDD